MANAYTVLVVDDEPPIRRFLRTSLAASDYRVVEAEDAAGAMRLLAAEKPDLMVLTTSGRKSRRSTSAPTIMSASLLAWRS